ncbi:Stealth CR1 domain-containing protein [Lacticaseibacillus sp. 866-1]|uniref:Stealth CR1 domain-containing protein n=1 Tax=Lacticaseibacillus sp. 866-1 TaxID=2799576 RepID=UPI0019433B06|nr:Stealth CR1 domain-containing protein [Lacticaseibacillus sp. 866-1]
MIEPIDFVVDWVDDTDPVWRKKRSRYRADTAEESVRYRDWGLFRYWFRAVESYSPWVRKVHLITDHQVPSWINRENPKLHLVNHDDYIDAKDLPTFNSNAIELPMHRIDNLSENFVFFNDDFYVNGPVRPTDFFTKEGVPKDSGILSPEIPIDNSITHITTNNVQVVNRYYSRSDVLKKITKFVNPRYGKENIKTIVSLLWKPIIGFDDLHIPISFTRQAFEEVWKCDSNELDLTLAHKFRDDADLNIFLMRYWQLMKGDFVPRRTNFGKYYNLSDDNADVIRDLKLGIHKLIVINDQSDISNFRLQSKIMQDVFREKLPNKSSFEK